MHLVQILLPLCDSSGAPLAREEFDRVSEELSDRFGGLSAFVRAPATWGIGSPLEPDGVLVYEVMTDDPDRLWWKTYREELLNRFRQRELVIRLSEVDVL